MSPAPQGNLQVERYIGSYLISQRPPNAAAKTNKRYQHNNQQQQQQHVKPKSPEEKVRFNKYCFPQRDVGGPGPGPPRYPMPPGMPVDCPGYNGHNGQNHHYKPNPGGSGWAGVPLISMTSGNPRRNKKPVPTNGQQHRQHHQQGYAKGKDEELSQAPDRSPLTRLAIHTQGAPLIQAGRYNNRSRANNYNRDQNFRVYKEEAVRWEASKELKPPQGVQNKDQPCVNADSLSVASDESSGNSENSLPRIIKPRKRRKKDRKPLTTPTAETDRYSGETTGPVEPSALDTFLPLRFGHDSENNHPDLLSGKLCLSEDKDDLIDPLPSADEFPFGNLLDDDEDGGSEASSCAPATLCQCRYCDPSGVIWDVDQRCYSPFLTPPSPTDRRPQPGAMSITPFGRPSPQSHFFDGDLGSLLRRSWSDPSSYNSEPPKSSGVERRPRPSSPAGLQVSSEIVTSPNGHRDIEIKFYSTSAPQETPKMKSSATDRDSNERCFVVEE